MRHFFAILILTISAGSPAYGQSSRLPKINFDVPAVIGCQEVTTPEFASTHSLEKLLEVRIKTSSLLETGPDRCIRELFFFVYSPEQSIQIVDFEPKTSLVTEYAGPIEESENRDNSSNAGFNFSPNFEIAGKASINANVSDRNGKSRRVSKLPPKQLAISSGTQKRGTAAFFKFKPSSQAALEGSHELTLFLKVPIAWRADLLHIHCRGVTSMESNGPKLVSRNDFLAPIHVAADAPAKLACEKLIRQERQLRRIAAISIPPKQKKDLAQKVSLFVKHELLGKRKPERPTPWAGQVIFNNYSSTLIESETGNKLDAKTKNIISEFRNARKQVVDLSD